MTGKNEWNPDWSTQADGSGAPQAAGVSVLRLAKRKRVVIPAALIALLFIGSAGSDGGGEEAPLAVTAAAGAENQAEADRDAAEEAAAEAAADRAAAEVALQQAEADKAAAEKAKAELEAQQAAAERAAAEAAAAAAAAEAERAAETARVAAEQAAADRAAAEAAQVQTFAAPPPAAAGGSAGTDPRFRTCKEALANGYGSYRQGVDPEYGWYRDADNDGVVCE